MVTQYQQRQARPDWVGDDQLRLARYQDARDFAAGVQWLGRKKRGEIRLTFNYGRRLVEKVSSYVFPSAVTFSVPSRVEGQSSKVEQLLSEVLDDVGADELDQALCVESGILGDAVVKVTWDVVEKRPQLAQVDPATVNAWYDPTLPTRVLRVCQTYQIPGYAIVDAFGGPEGLTPEGLYWVEEEWTAERWKATAAGQVVRDVPNPYGWLPYLFLPSNRQPRHLWGRSDLDPLYDALREFNLRMSAVSAILNLAGYPIAVLENVDGAESIVVAPGAKWEIPEGASASLLDLLQGGGVRLHMDYIEVLRRAIHDLSETPRTAFGDTGQPLSGAALEVEIQPLVQLVRRKRRMFNRYYRERNWRILDLLERMGGHDVGGLRRTVPNWPDILPSDRETAVRNAVSLVGSQIQSRRTAAQALGSEDPEGELVQIMAELVMLSAGGVAGDGEGDPRGNGN
jgi:hypothetical protein